QAVEIFHCTIATGTDQMGAGDVDEFIGGNAQTGLFAELAHEGVGGRFSVFDPAAGQIPEPAGVAEWRNPAQQKPPGEHGDTVSPDSLYLIGHVHSSTARSPIVSQT